MFFPESMRRARRWLVCSRKRPKQPFSPSAVAALRHSWNRPEIWRSLEECLSYCKSHTETIEGLSFVVHPGEDYSVRRRLIILDLDRVKDENRSIRQEAQSLIDLLETYGEWSRSGNGIHLVLETECTPFKNRLKQPLGETSIDVLCSAHIAATGNHVDGTPKEVRFVPFHVLQSLPFFQTKTASTAKINTAHIWGADPPDELDPVLVAEMEEWDPSISGEGGHNTIFGAACHLARRGITGWAALHLLEHVQAEPAWSESQLHHKVESAYNETIQAGEFGSTPTADVDFAEAPPLPSWVVEATKKPVRAESIYSVTELIKLDLSIDFIVDRVFIDQQATIIGGREKCFKTGIACDLLLSLATQTPFLGRFEIKEIRSAIFFTAEIGLPSARDLCIRILKARDHPLRVDNMFVADFVPPFNAKDEKEKKRNHNRLHRILDTFANPQVACFDPMYLAMGGAAVGDMYEIGEVLQQISEICRARDIWPIFCHHAKKDSGREFQPMELSDLYGSGVSAFARQWMLLAHQLPFAHGQANLFAKLGGSATGDLKTWDLQITEGQLDEINTERRWDVMINESGDGPKVDSSRILNQLVAEKAYSLKTIKALWAQEPKREQPRDVGAWLKQQTQPSGHLILQNGDYFLNEDNS